MSKINETLKSKMDKQQNFFEELHKLIIQYGFDYVRDYLVTSARVKAIAMDSGLTPDQIADQELVAYKDWIDHGMDYKKRIERKITLHSLTHEQFSELKELFKKRKFRVTTSCYTVVDQLKKASKKLKKGKRL